MPERTVEYTVTIQRLAFNPDKLTVSYKFLNDKEFAEALEIIAADSNQIQKVAEAQRERAYLIMGVKEHDKKLIKNQLSGVSRRDDGKWYATNFLTGAEEVFDDLLAYQTRLKEIRGEPNKDNQEQNPSKSTG